MAYKKKALYDKALKVIEKDEDLVYIEDLCIDLGISGPTFYKHFKVDSKEFNDIKEALSRNKAKIKKAMRKNWREKDSSASTQIALYKLLATKEEREILNGEKDQQQSTQNVIKIEGFTPIKSDGNDSE